MIVLCGKCEGAGRLCWDEGAHKSELKYGVCDKCNGCGRMILTATKTETPMLGTESTRIF